MSDSDQNEMTAADMAVLSRMARLPLAETRPEVVGPALSGLLTLFDSLDAVDLGETPPTNSFDARWRGRS